jgi:hypothetical protein
VLAEDAPEDEVVLEVGEDHGAVWQARQPGGKALGGRRAPACTPPCARPAIA